jgi:hypothetical protein
MSFNPGNNPGIDNFNPEIPDWAMIPGLQTPHTPHGSGLANKSGRYKQSAWFMIGVLNNEERCVRMTLKRVDMGVPPPKRKLNYQCNISSSFHFSFSFYLVFLQSFLFLFSFSFSVRQLF